jgi:alpha-tubulin suppressor-like RCC1 family protein
VWSFGLNDQGQCGQPVLTMAESPDMAVAARPRAIKLDELAKKTVVGISAGSYHSALITGTFSLSPSVRRVVTCDED